MKSEKQKMLDGELYKPYDIALKDERNRAYDLLFNINHTPPVQKINRARMLKELLGSTGKDFQIEQPFHCDYGYNIHIGENFYANVGCTILDAAEVRIGNDVLLAPNVGIYTAGHPIDNEQRAAGLEYAYPITIGNNVWIGASVVVLPGVTIGDNAVIGAGSVVTKSIPPNVVAVGNPCKVIKECDSEK